MELHIEPQITAAGDNVYVVWKDNNTGNDEVNFKTITDNGRNISRSFNLSRNNGTSFEPQITATGDNVYMVWKDNNTGNDEVNFKTITDNGRNISRSFNLSRNNGTSSEPQITAAGDNVYVVWKDNNTGNDEVNFKTITDNGRNISRSFNLSRNNGTSSEPQITALGIMYTWCGKIITLV